jgi:hypothetical protein
MLRCVARWPFRLRRSCSNIILFLSGLHLAAVGVSFATSLLWIRRHTIRVNVTARWLLRREMALEEVTVVPLLWIPSILASFTYGAAISNGQPSASWLFMSVALFMLGSTFNTYSELERKWWKARPENKVCRTASTTTTQSNINVTMHHHHQQKLLNNNIT